MCSTNIQTAIRVRPLIEREKKEKLDPIWLVKENSIVQIDSYQNFIGEPYSFDHIFDHKKSNKDVYDSVVKPMVKSCLEGIHVTIFAYGQTSSGKTHTMLGDKNTPGIISYAVQDIFSFIQETCTKDFLLRCSYLEIYNEKIKDLLDRNATDIKIRECFNSGIYVEAKEEVIREPSELFNIMKKGMKTRKIGCTDMNERSSRSHTIFKLVIHSQNKGDSEVSTTTESILSLVDLAGSERVGQMNMGGVRQVEGVSINKSLTTLGLVIRKLSENETYINYRDSKLTRILQDSLGGNSKTLIIATVTVAAEETKSTLEFAQRAKKVQNRPIINERKTDKDQLKQYEFLCEDYKKQVEKLRQEKVEREKTIEVLEGKIGNIKLFTDGNCEQPLSKIPARRHTMGFYKYHANPVLPRFSDDFEHDEMTKPFPLSPAKSDICFKISNTDDKENSILQSPPVTPISCKEFKFPDPPKTPYSSLKVEKGLLEESYETLKEFTSLEKLLQDKGEEVQDLLKLIENLRDENCKLLEEKLKCEEKAREDLKYISERLPLLENILKPPDEKPLSSKRTSLTTIVEEELELFSDNIENSANSIESDSLNSKESDEGIKLNLLVEHLRCELLNKETELAVLTQELKNVLNESSRKDEMIQNLQIKITQERDVKEAELQILNNQIIKSNLYKETIHTEMAKLKKQNEELQNGKNLRDDDEVRAITEDLRTELASKESQICDLKNINLGLDIKLKKSISELQVHDSLIQEIDHLKCKCVNKDHEVDQLQKANHDLNEKIVFLTANMQEKEKLQSELSNKTSQLDKLKSDLEESQFRLAGEQQELECTTQELDFAKQQVKELEAAILALETKDSLNIVYNEQLKGLEDQLNHLASQNLGKDDEIGSLKSTVHNLLENIALLEQQLVNAQNQLLKQESQVEQLKADLEKANLRLCDDQVELERGSHELSAAKEQVRKLKEKVLALDTLGTKNNDSLKYEIDLLKSDGANKDTVIDLLQKSNDDLNQRLVKLTEREIETSIKLQELERINKELGEKVCNIESLESTIVTLRRSREESVKEVLHLKRQLAQAESNFEITVSKKLEQQLDNAQSQLRKQESQVEELKSDLEKAQFQLRDGQVELERTYREFTSAKQQVEKLKEKIVALESELSKVTFNAKDYDCLKYEIDLLKSENTHKDIVIGTMQKSNDDLNQRIVKLAEGEYEMSVKVQELERINKELEEKVRSIESLENTVVALKSFREESIKEVLLLKRQLAKTESDLKINESKKLEQQLDNAQSQLRKRESQVDKLKSDLEKAQLQVSDDQVTLERTSLELTAAKQQIEKLKEKIVALESELSKVTFNIEDFDSLKYKIDLLKSDGTNKDTVIGTLQKSNDDVNQKIVKLAKRENELSVKLQESERINKELESTVVTLKSFREESIKEVLLLNRQLAQAESDLKIKESKKLKDMENDKRLTESEFARHEKLMQEYKCELARIHESLIAKERDLANKVKENESLAKANLNLNQKIRDLEAEINVLKTNDKDSGDVDALKLQLRALEAQLNEKKRQAQYAREDYLNLKRTYDSLEEKLFSCKKELADQKRLSTKSDKTLEIIRNVMETSNVGLKYMPLEQQLTELVLKLNGSSADLAAAHVQASLKSRELSAAQAELARVSLEHNSCLKTIDNLNREKNGLLRRLGETEKLLATERKSCVILEGKVGELLQFKKTVQEPQEKIAVSRTSDESSRSMSPNEVRRIKRQSLHDQRRGLSPDIADSDDDWNGGCGTCAKLSTEISNIKRDNKKLKGQISELSNDIRELHKENEDSLNRIKNVDKRKESQEKENADLKNTILLLSDQISLKGDICKADKGVQVDGNSDIHEKLMRYKYLAVTRREEANYLRSKLGLPADCPVLPANAQTQKKT